ncbi:MAG: AAA family ATPase [Bdellovibrionota bacterium]
MIKKYPKIPLGIDDFDEIRTGNFCYADKTALVEQVVEGSFKVALIARPRRFGKTLNLSMLKYFFDINYQKPEGMGEKHIFEGLIVAKNDELCTQHMNKYPVLFMSFKGIQYKEHSLFLDNLREFFAFELKKYNYLLDSPFCSESDKIKFSNLLLSKANESELSKSIQFMTALLEQHHKVKPYVFIDEYDAPIHYAYNNGTYKSCVDFFSVLYGTALKGNTSLQKAVLTGILRVSRESIFSDLNNLAVYTVLQENYSSHFGFLEPEVQTLLKTYNLEQHFPQIQAWYNGYRFGESSTGIYNPWSILKWLEDGTHTFASYWVNTSRNDIIRTLYLEQRAALKPEFFELFLGNTITTRVNTETTFDANLTQDPAIFWGFVLQTGYLTVADVTREGDEYFYKLKIPNKEVGFVFKNMVNAWLETLTKDLEKPKLAEIIMNSLVYEDLPVFYETLQKILVQTMSYHDFAQNSENAYHAFMAGLMIWLSGIYYIKSNREAGLGRYDLALIPRKENVPAYLFEFKAIKYIKKADSVEDRAQLELEQAFKQINEKNYAEEFGLKPTQAVIKVALVFYGKQVWMKS